MKKIVSLFLACLMVLSIGIIPAFATTEKTATYASGKAEEELLSEVGNPLPNKPNSNTFGGSKKTVSTSYLSADGVIVRNEVKDEKNNVYFEIAADSKGAASYYEHALGFYSPELGSVTTKRFSAKVKVPSTTGATYVFGQRDATSEVAASTPRILTGFGVQLVSGQARYYDPANKKLVNFLDEGKSIEANKWYTIEAIMDARGVTTGSKTGDIYMNAFVYNDVGELIGNSGWKHVSTGGAKWSATCYMTEITASRYEAGYKVFVDEFKVYKLSDLPSYTNEEPTYPKPVTITETRNNKYIAAKTSNTWFRMIGERFNYQAGSVATNSQNLLGNGSANTAAQYNISFRIPEFGATYHLIDFVEGRNMVTDNTRALDGAAKIDGTGLLSALKVDGTSAEFEGGATGYQLTANTWYNLEVLIDYSTFAEPKATLTLKSDIGQVLAQTSQQYTVAAIPVLDNSNGQSSLMWAGISTSGKYIHFDNTKVNIAPTYADILANTNLKTVIDDDFEIYAGDNVSYYAEGANYAALVGALHDTHSDGNVTSINNAKVAIEGVPEQVTVVKDVDFSFTYDNAVPNSNINYNNIKLLEDGKELVGGVDYIVTPANDGGIDGAETSKNFTIVMPKLRVNTTYTLRLMAGLSDYNTGDVLTSDKAIKYGIPADHALYTDITFTTPEAAKETTIVSSLVDSSDAAVVALAKNTVIKGKVDIENNDESAIAGYVILGIYDGDQLVTALISETAFSAAAGATISASTPEYTVAKDGLKAKVFVWKDLTNLQPIIAAEVVPAE